MTRKSSQALHDFLAEAEEILEQLNVDVALLSEQAERGDIDPDLVNAIFRGAHSLKGLSGMFGFADISDLSHELENLLDRLRLGKITPDARLFEILFQGLELLTSLVAGKGEDEHFTLDLEPLRGRIGALLEGGAQAQDDPLAGLDLSTDILNVLTEYEEHRLRENLARGRHLYLVKASFSLASFDQELEELTARLKENGEVISTLPGPGDGLDQIGFQLLTGSDLDAEQLARSIDRDPEEIRPVSRPAGGVRHSVETGDSKPVVGGEPSPSAGADEPAESIDGGGTLRSFSRTVRVDIEKLDNLMNIVGEMVLSKGAISRIADEIRHSVPATLATDLQKAVKGLERRLGELQAAVMEVRMVPVAQLFDKMNRIVRRVASEHRKLVSLKISGAETELDKLIVEDLTDPLMHIIRNAIDHGIEPPEERAAAGKPERATIELRASQKGNHVVIEVQDDGKGIDPELVREKAVAKGLVSPGADLGREEIYDLLFTPGFSTRDEVTDLSGRGVGMDVVKNNIAALSGMVEIDSEKGKGTCITITLPITLAIIKALIVQVCGRTYAIPINSVLETLMIEPDAIETIEGREVIELRNTTLPLMRLSEVFGLELRCENDDRLFVAVVGMAEKRMGIVVDELAGQQDVVIKSLGAALSFVRGIAGAADLGNQKTILVLDVGGLMNEALRGEATAHV
ncbi:two-component system chemotaxis sensor kinase CheA [Geothermobacter ehrlichii]|uniref:histidine kinase n=1 Tax=Geothermobacter ehrlichii TaxID=213224 RepID=A0A5D3WRB4_9BACT|nr:chemotaxis protein CheA [Geothermobacter ehrlichii]TYP00129.1 two-component system chemotaxis sensor kinase CheA [Geothermobacter ehrlichii]